MGEPEIQNTLNSGRHINLNLTYAQFHKIWLKRAEPVEQWLANNIDCHRLISAKGLGVLIRRNVPQATDMSEIELLDIINSWASRKHISILRTSVFPIPGEHLPQPPTMRNTSSSQLLKGLKKALNMPTSMTFRHENNQLKIGISGTEISSHQGNIGARIKLGLGGISNDIEFGKVTTSFQAGWDGTLGVKTTYRDFSFSASLSKDKWKMELKLWGGAFPSLSNLESIFKEGYSGIEGIAGELRQFPSVNEIPDAAKRVSKHFGKTKKAIQAAQRVSQHNPQRVHFGITADASRKRKADSKVEVRVKATLTITF